MGTYISQSDVENKFGTTNVAKWSQLDNAVEEADTDRIATAIAFAEELVESMFRGGRYAVPFSGTCLVLKDWCAVHAGKWLYSNRGSAAPASQSDADRFNAMAEEADAQIRAAAGGSIKLPLALANPTATVPVVIRGDYGP